jgi:hypothetical protein
MKTTKFDLYHVRHRGQQWPHNTKKEAVQRARSVAEHYSANARYKVRVYGLVKGQTRGELMYRCWINRNGKLVGEDR